MLRPQASGRKICGTVKDEMKCIPSHLHKKFVSATRRVHRADVLYEAEPRS